MTTTNSKHQKDFNIKRITFVVTEGEVRVPGNRGRQGEVKAMSAQRFVFVHGADGLDHLEHPRKGPRATFRTRN